jgi:hypothetical protein
MNMTEPEPNWGKIMAERRKNLPAMREGQLMEARDILNKIARMSANAEGSPFVTALRFNREELLEIQSVLRKWVERDAEFLLEALHGR